MKNLKTLFVAAAATLFLSSCSITLPVTATSNAIGSKVGVSSATCYLGLLCFDADASIQTAAKNAGISKISTVDIKQKNLLNIVITYETIVTGD